MSFNSYEFIFIFLPITLIIFYSLPSTNLAVLWMVTASLIFYGLLSPRFLPLLILSVLVNYSISLKLKASASKRLWLVIGICINFLVLAWFKFTESIRALKLKYHTDRAHTDAQPWTYEQFLGDYQPGDFALSKKELAALLDRNVRETLSDQLTLTFAKQFAELSLEEIDSLTDSFLFENCLVYEPWAKIFKEFSPIK